MKHVGVCSVLIACCLAAPAWAVRFGEQESAVIVEPASPSDAQVQIVEDESYAPWQIYGNGSPYDQSAIAGYNPWPQVCVDGIWDNFCNERHCLCYKGPKQHGGHCGLHGRKFGAGCGNGGNCGHGGNCASGNCATSVDSPALDTHPVDEPVLQPQPAPAAPAVENSSARLLPRSNLIQQPLIPAFWKNTK